MKGYKHKFHESKESLLKEAFEHEPKLHKVPNAYHETKLRHKKFH